MVGETMWTRLKQYLAARPERLLTVVVGVLLCIGIVGFIVHQSSLGTITITTNDKTSTVTLSAFDSKGVDAQGKGSLHARVSADQYVVSVSNRTTTAKRTVTVLAHKSVAFSIHLAKAVGTVPVFSYGAYGISAASTSMYYVDVRDNFLYYLTAGNPPSVVNEGITFKDVRWQDSSHGIGLASDGKSLYAISGNSLTQLSLPFSTNVTLFDAAANGTVVVSDGKSIYVQSAGLPFVRIYTADAGDKVSSVRSGGKFVLAQVVPGGQTEADESLAVVLDLNGKTVASQKDFSVYVAKWSPNGDKLAVTSDSTTAVYNSRLQLLSRAPDANVLGLSWQSDTTVLYGLGNNLYSYNTTSKLRTQLATVSTGAVAGIYTSQGGTQIFISTEPAGSTTNENMRLLRVSQGDSELLNVKLLGVVLPFQLDQCSVDLVNFTSPIVVMTPYSSITGGACQQAATAALTKDGVNTSGLTFYTRPVLVNVD